MAAAGIGDVLIDRYELLAELGRGRSVVYRARDHRLGREVAIKKVEVGPVADAPDSEQNLARARREARATARITSPNVVAVYDVIEQDAALWLIMELVRAPSLAAIVAERGPLDEPLAAAIGLGVLDALVAAHAQGIVHRDVKPSNVLVELDPTGADEVPPDIRPEPLVKLADFGVAALRDETTQTAPGAVIGSPSYMSPEQASGKPVGPASDMWGLGALLYFAVEGEPPFDAGSAIATATAVVHEPPRPQQHPGRLSEIIGALLTKDPDARPDAARVRAALQAVAGAPADTGAVAAATAAAPAAAAGGDETVALRREARPAAAAWLDRLPPGARRAALAAALAVVVLLVLGAALLLPGDGGERSPEADVERRDRVTTTTLLDGSTTTTVDDEDLSPRRPATTEPERPTTTREERERSRSRPTTTAPPRTTTTEEPTTTTTDEDTTPTTDGDGTPTTTEGDPPTTTSTPPSTPPSTGA